jgi:hypothetical protein
MGFPHSFITLPLPNACRPALRTDALITRRILFERSKLVRLHILSASVKSDEAGRGVNGFGSYCRNKRTSAAGPKPIAVKLSLCLALCGGEDRRLLRAFPTWSSVRVADVFYSAAGSSPALWTDTPGLESTTPSRIERVGTRVPGVVCITSPD